MSKQIILKYNKTFGGTLSDGEVQELAGISRNSLYLYKRELKEQIEHSSIERTIEQYNNLAEIIRRKSKQTVRELQGEIEKKRENLREI